MKDADLAESREKSNFRFFQFLFFELWSFFYHYCDVITPIFDDFFRSGQVYKKDPETAE